MHFKYADLLLEMSASGKDRKDAYLYADMKIAEM